ncbi:hypothetical protein Bbelb_061750 [Branchiostoma belcheri]|nr:hypothetical protein Bbelb_061750 [Branchiostoma belcheri]
MYLRGIAWDYGRCDEGVVILVSTEDRQVRWTHLHSYRRYRSRKLTDEIVDNIYVETREYFTAGRWAEGLKEMVTRYKKVLARGSSSVTAIVFGCVFGVFLSSRADSYRGRVCSALFTPEFFNLQGGFLTSSPNNDQCGVVLCNGKSARLGTKRPRVRVLTCHRSCALGKGTLHDFPHFAQLVRYYQQHTLPGRVCVVALQTKWAGDSPIGTRSVACQDSNPGPLVPSRERCHCATDPSLDTGSSQSQPDRAQRVDNTRQHTTRNDKMRQHTTRNDKMRQLVLTAFLLGSLAMTSAQGTRSVACQDSNPGPLDSTSRTLPLKMSVVCPITPVSHAAFYPYGPGTGDILDPTADDSTSGAQALSTAFPFFGNTYNELFVNTNGDISFGVAVTSYTPRPFPVTNNRVLAVYFTDIKTSNGGRSGYIYHRETTDAAILARATTDIQTAFPADHGSFVATWAYVATWHKRNTFQLVMITDGQKSFTLYNYARIDFLQGETNGGNGATGTGPNPAQHSAHMRKECGKVKHTALPAD